MRLSRKEINGNLTSRTSYSTQTHRLEYEYCPIGVCCVCGKPADVVVFKFRFKRLFKIVRGFDFYCAYCYGTSFDKKVYLNK